MTNIIFQWLIETNDTQCETVFFLSKVEKDIDTRRKERKTIEFMT